MSVQKLVEIIIIFAIPFGDNFCSGFFIMALNLLKSEPLVRKSLAICP